MIRTWRRAAAAGMAFATGASWGAMGILIPILLPLAAQLGRSYPGDYGDPLFVTWVRNRPN